MKEKFLFEELLPTLNGKYTKASDALLSGSEKLTEFLNEDDIQILFDKKDWLETTITDVKTRELRNYLMTELKIPEVDFESFARKITVEFLQAKSDEWMINFYNWLSDRSTREKSILKTKPIIRLDINEHIAPFDDKGKIQVYLPAETKSKYKTVKRILTENENSLKFLKELGLTEPDLFAEIREFILPKYQTDNPVKDEGYFEDFEKLLKSLETIPVNKKKEFMEELSKASFIDSVNNVSGENRLRTPSEIYLPEEDLKNYFDGYSVYFVSDVPLYEKFGKERLNSFLRDLGVENKPRRIKIKSQLSLEEKKLLRGDDDYRYDNSIEDFQIDGLNQTLANVTKKKSTLLWNYLLQSMPNSAWQAEKFFQGKYSYHIPYNDRTKYFASSFLKSLRQNNWLFDQSGNKTKPSLISVSQLDSDYDHNSVASQILIQQLQFKPDAFDQLPENDRKILEIARARNITPEDFENLLSALEKKPSDTEEKTWSPECEPDKVSPRITEVEPDKIVTPDLTGQDGKTETAKDEKPTIETEKPEERDVQKTKIDRKAVGNWGEEYVYNVLKKEYQEREESLRQTLDLR